MDRILTRRSNSLLLSAFSLFVASSFGCQSTGDGQAQIIEQSRRQAPTWISAESALSANSELIYVNKKDRVVDLPLGLAQAQESSIINLQLIVRNRIMTLASSKGELPPADKAAIDKSLKTILREKVSEKDIQDIYFERIAPADPQGISMPDYYRIYMLMKVDKQRLMTILTQLKTDMGKAGHVKLAALIGSIDTQQPR